MKVRYDFHIHSALSPCAENDMTPANIAGFAALSGLDMIAVADHNAIGNVRAVSEAGRAMGVEVVPAFELQTLEDVHLLCLFEDIEMLEKFYSTVKFTDMENRPEIFGQQLIIDTDDNIVGTEKRLLLTSAEIYCAEAAERIKEYGGVAVPAHIDREENGMLAVLGSIMPEFGAVEFSSKADEEMVRQYYGKYRLITDSDAHTLDDISLSGEMELPSPTAASLISYLKGKDGAL